MLFNRLVRLRNQVRTAWADIDVQLTRRHDLVPSLVAAVKGYAGHEAALLEAVTALRARATPERAPGRLGQLEGELEHALGRLVALQEAYPDLKASETFAQLPRALVEAEEHLQYPPRLNTPAGSASWKARWNTRWEGWSRCRRPIPTSRPARTSRSCSATWSRSRSTCSTHAASTTAPCATTTTRCSGCPTCWWRAASASAPPNSSRPRANSARR